VQGRIKESTRHGGGVRVRQREKTQDNSRHESAWYRLSLSLSRCICMYVCMYVRMYMCIFMCERYTYMYIYKYVSVHHRHTSRSLPVLSLSSEHTLTMKKYKLHKQLDDELHKQLDDEVPRRLMTTSLFSTASAMEARSRAWKGIALIMPRSPINLR
jgi:hypothetical protein